MKIKSSINKSSKFGNLEFSNREDYVDYFIKHKIVPKESEIWESEHLINTIHKHWHGEGANGCVFALLAARKKEERGWHNLIFTQKIHELTKENIKLQITSKIEASLKNPNCEILSILFSNIITTSDLVVLIRFLLEIDIIKLEDEQIIDKWVTLALRIPINSEGALSWLMAFAPFIYFPTTRQSPILEIAIRTKEKPKKLFYRLNKDFENAHLADLPLDFREDVMEKVWDKTLERTRIILDDEPNHFSAAKTTFTLPAEDWLKK